jgi:hypothetical protein
MYNVCPHSLIKIYIRVCMMEYVGNISYNRRTNICVHFTVLPLFLGITLKGHNDEMGFFIF